MMTSGMHVLGGLPLNAARGICETLEVLRQMYPGCLFWMDPGGDGTKEKMFDAEGKELKGESINRHTYWRVFVNIPSNTKPTDISAAQFIIRILRERQLWMDQASAVGIVKDMVSQLCLHAAKERDELLEA